MEERKDMISVIIPVYNGQDYLENCIKSLGEQTFKAFEIVIVNDGSTDGTGALCEKLCAEHENIRVLTLDDQGVSAARNEGLKEARGEFITFVDADDRVRSDMLEVLYNLITSTGSDLAGCDFFAWQNETEWKKGSSRERYAAGASEEITVLPWEDFLTKGILLKDTRCWAKLYKRSLIGEHRFRKGLSIGEDMLFLLELLPDLNKAANISYAGYGYYQNPEGAMNRPFTPSYMDQITCWELARGEVLQLDRELNDELTAKIMIAIMLTVGKIAVLPGKERKNQKEYVHICHDKLMEEIKVEDALENLDRGYRLKVKLFSQMPGFYVWLYHFRRYFK